MDKDLGRRGNMGRRISVIQDEDDHLFSSKIISRNSSFGCSSRIYYYRSSEGIPFNWEMQPGRPKEPQKEDILAPISPPPAVLSLALPKPRFNIEEPKPSTKLMRFKFWKHGNKNHVNKKIRAAASKGGKNLDVSNNYRSSDYKYSNYEMCSSDDGDHFMASPPQFSSSSSSSSFSFSNGFSFRSSSPSRNSSLDRHYGCSPLLSFYSILVRVTKSRGL